MRRYNNIFNIQFFFEIAKIERQIASVHKNNISNSRDANYREFSSAYK